VVAGRSGPQRALRDALSITVGRGAQSGDGGARSHRHRTARSPRQARLDATARESLRVAAELGAVCAALAAAAAAAGPPCAPATNSDSLPWQLAPPARPDFNVFAFGG
jgi:hypothetical protein